MEGSPDRPVFTGGAGFDTLSRYSYHHFRQSIDTRALNPWFEAAKGADVISPPTLVNVYQRQPIGTVILLGTLYEVSVTGDL